MKKLLLTLTLLTVASTYALTPNDKKLFEAIINERDINKTRTALEQGANINALTDDTTPLLGAIYINNPAMVRFLIENGADCNRLDPFLEEDHMGVNLHILFAVEVLNQEILELLLKNTNPINQYTLDYVLCGAVEFATNPGCLDDMDCDYCTKIQRRRMTTCTHGKKALKCKPCMRAFIKLLLEHGASPYTKTAYDPEDIKYGDYTIAYQLAKKSKDKALIKLLEKYKPSN